MQFLNTILGVRIWTLIWKSGRVGKASIIGTACLAIFLCLDVAAAESKQTVFAYIAAPFLVVGMISLQFFVFFAAAGRYIYDHILDDRMRAQIRANPIFRYLLELPA